LPTFHASTLSNVVKFVIRGRMSIRHGLCRRRSMTLEVVELFRLRFRSFVPALLRGVPLRA
jgi:hypothetical protein